MSGTIDIVPGHLYGVDTGDGNALTAGLQAHEARAAAQRIADSMGETVYLYDATVAGRLGDDSDAEEHADENMEAVHPSEVAQ